MDMNLLNAKMYIASEQAKGMVKKSIINVKNRFVDNIRRVKEDNDALAGFEILIMVVISLVLAGLAVYFGKSIFKKNEGRVDSKFSDFLNTSGDYTTP